MEEPSSEATEFIATLRRVAVTANATDETGFKGMEVRPFSRSLGNDAADDADLVTKDLRSEEPLQHGAQGNARAGIIFGETTIPVNDVGL